MKWLKNIFKRRKHFPGFYEAIKEASTAKPKYSTASSITRSDLVELLQPLEEIIKSAEREQIREEAKKIDAEIIKIGSEGEVQNK